MPKIDFSQIEALLNSSSSFSLSETQYREMTGRGLPKDSNYIVKRSALAKFVKERGLRIKVNERTISFEKDE